MKDIKALAFFDLDGTLLNSNSEVDADVALAMQHLKSNGVMPIIATGRTNVEIQTIMTTSFIHSAITMNGQYVQFNGKEIYSATISKEHCEKLKSFTQKKGHDLGFYTPDYIRVTNHNQMVEKCYNYIHSTSPPIDGNLYKKEAINMLLIISEEGDSYYEQAFPDLTFYRNGPYSIDTVSLGGSKGVGVTKLVDKLGLEHLPRYAFGDGLNDIALFSACQHRIAMGNARPELKKLATYQTTKNTEGGIINALKHFNLL